MLPNAATEQCFAQFGRSSDVPKAVPVDSSSPVIATTSETLPKVECISVPSTVLADIDSGEENGVGMLPVLGFAVWPDADRTRAAIASNDPSVTLSKSCL